MVRMSARPVSRVAIVLPPTAPVADALTDALAAALFAHGVQVTRHVRGASVDGGVRADVALWWPDPDGHVPVVDRARVHARVHAALLDGAPRDPSALATFDAVCVVHEALLESARLALAQAGVADGHVVHVRLPLSPSVARDVAKARHHVSGHAVVLVDVCDAFERDIERVMIQLALVGAPHVRVLHVPHDEKARARAREVAERHGVDAWLTSGPNALTGALVACDLFVGRPTTSTLLFAALHGVATVWLEGSGDARPPVESALVAARTVSTVDGVLHLAAVLERRLADRAGIDVEGTLLRAALVGEARPFIEVLGQLREHQSVPRGHLAWEAIGPTAGANKPAPVVVDARGADSEIERAARIEDALRRLKERVKEGEA